MKKIGLLPRILIAIVLGVLIGNVLPEAWVRIFVTFNGLFSQFLGFLIPLIIIGLVAPAIADIGRAAGRLLLLTVVLAYADTIVAGLLAFATGTMLFPMLIDSDASMAVEKTAGALQPYFQLQIPAILDVMAALVSSFVIGIGIAYTDSPTLKKGFSEFRTIIEKTIQGVIIPLLPLYIFGIFLGMTFTGEAYHIILVFAKIICIIFLLHIFILLYEFLIAGGLARKNPFRLLVNMLPAYFTALGTSSSAATIPVTLRQVKKNGVSDDVASFCVPLCATIHLSGSMMKITCCALTVCLIGGLPHDLPLFLHFIMLLGVCMVAAPGVPGGAVMAALGPLAGILGFSPDAQALIIALYIAMDSFGTACNVTGDGALAVIIDRLHQKPDSPSLQTPVHDE
ncbi:Na+/H+-dicarboxylate symporter [Prevotella sp. ne3005]|uniref:dicarboxylate/amino acid:cation symporter n=1 Tax=Prevotella sp. ne3005 TaxID=1761887 RepID=UPI0008B8AC4B|nr:dicarboxylate/amino acid:cation symporter [Prevotella sp. ne3005]SEM77595.1 Na+/H+-dicarboxylate symporter [Prevotella sp. ne3005]